MKILIVLFLIVVPLFGCNNNGKNKCVSIVYEDGIGLYGDFKYDECKSIEVKIFNQNDSLFKKYIDSFTVKINKTSFEKDKFFAFGKGVYTNVNIEFKIGELFYRITDIKVGLHYENTMFSSNQRCVVVSYKENGKLFEQYDFSLYKELGVHDINIHR